MLVTKRYNFLTRSGDTRVCSDLGPDFLLPQPEFLQLRSSRVYFCSIIVVQVCTRQQMLNRKLHSDKRDLRKAPLSTNIFCQRFM